MELVIGQRLEVIDALGKVWAKRALSPLTDDNKPGFIACSEDEWAEAERQGRDPEPDPFAWPVGSIR